MKNMKGLKRKLGPLRISILFAHPQWTKNFTRLMVNRIDVWVENGIIQLLVYFRLFDKFQWEGING
jgi:hypothetical protein